MQRTIYQKLLAWKNSPRRKPLLLQGARQVGKTWLMNKLGREAYANYVYLNFEQSPELINLFEGSKDPHTIITDIGLLIGQKITSADTLICFDEIQVAPDVLTSLKYFQEQAPDYHVIAAGSLLGVQVGITNSFPVGKVNFMTVYPLSFEEFLTAIGESALSNRLQEASWPINWPEVLHEKMLGLYKTFVFLGGMPEVIQYYLDEADIPGCRNIQLEILRAYAQDFAKYADGAQTLRTSAFWQSIPFQLAKENKKFKYNAVQKNARASTFAETVNWLQNAGLIHQAFALRAAKLPLLGYRDDSKFKVYLHDTGLLGAMLQIPTALMVAPNELFKEYNGALTENMIAQEMVKAGWEHLFYWTYNHTAEVDFVLAQDGIIFPIEVKSGLNRNTRSLRQFGQKHDSQYLLRLSPRNFTQDDDLINLPLYAIFLLPGILKQL